MKAKDVYIDADHILYLVAEAKSNKSDLDGESLNDPNVTMKHLKEMFKNIVDDYTTTAEVESILYKWTIGKTHVVLSDKTNFRFELYDNYKANRSQSSDILKKLKKWARKKYRVETNTEADDVVAYYVRNGAIGFTTDKDLLYGVEGLWFNAHHKHKCWLKTKKKEAKDFMLHQCLAGDPVDNIKGIPKVGMKTATKLLDEFGHNWDGVVKAYESKGLTRDDAVLTRRLVDMSLWTPEFGVNYEKII